MEALALEFDPETEQQIRRFLLGTSRAPEKAWASEAVEIVETELIDEYFRNELTPDDLRRFNCHYLRQPGNQGKMEIAAAFHRTIRRSRISRRRMMGSGIAGLSILTLLGYWQFSMVTLYPGRDRKSTRLN